MNLEIKIFNTLSGKQEKLDLIDDNHLKIYVCGPTVYDRPHLGNARSIVIYDLFYRLFYQIYNKVTYVRNITDVDDKINAAAKERNISIKELTDEIIELFYDDINALNNLSPTYEPKATENISEIIAMIQKLIANNNAYISEGHVLFDVESYADYGKLSNRNIAEMIAGSRVEVASYKRNPLDFVLWKPAAEGDDLSSVFESPWSKGRPGWHIECSAMSSKYLGPNFDIHGGGADLQFPHHENEIAQSCCANKGSNYANFWIHNGFLTVNGDKMSKSLKNFITVRQLLDKGIDGITIRYFLLSTHYRKPLDFNQKALDDSHKSLLKFYKAIADIDFGNLKNYPNQDNDFLQKILQNLADDLNIAKVTALLHGFVKEIKTNPNDQKLKYNLANSLDFLGLLDLEFYKKNNSSNNSQEIDENFINNQIKLRLEAKLNKDYDLADKIRQNLLKQGVVLEDVSKDKTIYTINNL